MKKRLFPLFLALFSAARTIGYTVLDLMACPDELARAKAEFAERTGGGIGGSR